MNQRLSGETLLSIEFLKYQHAIFTDNVFQLNSFRLQISFILKVKIKRV